MGGTKENRRGIERQVQRKEECENARHHERDNLGQNMPRRKQHEKGDELHCGRHDECLADFGRDHLVTRVHGVGSERGAAGERDIQRDGGQKGDSPDDGCDKHDSKIKKGRLRVKEVT